MPHRVPLRQGALDPNDKGLREREDTLQWRELRPWPIDLRFEDGRCERFLEQAMPPRPSPIGTFPSSSSAALASRFAEPDC